MRTYLSFLLIIILLSGCKNNEEADGYIAIKDFKSIVEDGYMGDAQCMKCHKTTYDSWKNSDHDRAMHPIRDILFPTLPNI